MRTAVRVACIFLAACGDPDGEPVDPVDMMPDVIGALPSFQQGTGVRASAVGDPVQDQLILNRFKLECHPENGPGACPAGVPIDLSTKYSSDTILGLLAGAEAHTNEVLGRAFVGTCTLQGTPSVAKAVTLASFVSTDTGGNGARFLVDEVSRLACVADLSPTRHVAWALPDATKREVVTIAKHESVGGADQSFINQTVILLDASKKARVVALNEVDLTTKDAATSNARAIVIANLATRRFLLKMSGGSSNVGVVAAGQAGLSVAGIASPGLYYARGNVDLCIDNATRTEADPAGCAIESVAWEAGTTPAAYLELSPADAALLAKYLAFFADGATATKLTAAEVPGGAADRVHFPDKIQ